MKIIVIGSAEYNHNGITKVAENQLRVLFKELIAPLISEHQEEEPTVLVRMTDESSHEVPRFLREKLCVPQRLIFKGDFDFYENSYLTKERAIVERANYDAYHAFHSQCDILLLAINDKEQSSVLNSLMREGYFIPNNEDTHNPNMKILVIDTNEREKSVRKISVTYEFSVEKIKIREFTDSVAST